MYLGAFLLYRADMSATCPQSEASSANVPPLGAAAKTSSVTVVEAPAIPAPRSRHLPSRNALGRFLPRAKAAKPRSWRAQRAALLVLPTARTAEGRRLREFRQGLIDHLGGRPSAVQMTLIDRATVLMHHLAHLDRRAEIEGGLSEHATRVFLAWQNTLTRTLQAIGLRPAAAPAGPSLSDYIATKGPTDDR